MAYSLFYSWLPLLSLLFLCALFHHGSATMAASDDPVKFVESYCNTAGNYTPGTTFQANLNSLLASLSLNASAAGYYNDTRGRGTEEVYGLSLCRGDINASECQDCLAFAVGEAQEGRCRFRKTATVLTPRCLLRYSNISFFGNPEGHLYDNYNVNNANDLEIFDALLNVLVENVTARAAASPIKFATGEASMTVMTRIYAMAQCTRDLSADACSRCLRAEINVIPTCCAGKQGGVMFGGSCNLRYELYDFYNATSTPVIGPPPPPTGSAGSAPSPPPTMTATSDKKKLSAAAIVGIVVAVAGIAAIGILIIGARWRRKGRPGDELISSSECVSFDLATLKAATDNFSDSNKLGQGGFGAVYKGSLSDGQEIAVKRLSQGSWQGQEELKNEVILVAKLQHRNLVRLIGYSLGEEEKLLVYEYLQNKSLEKFLSDPVNSKELTWERRRKIIEGIARGLLYLHEDSRLKIIHRDMKAGNILLDEELMPKISDFGLAKLFGRDQNQGDTSRIAGTFGYMAPEYVLRGLFSTKSDVYSFGVLVLEVITGRRSSPHRGAGHDEDLLSFVWKHWSEGNALQVVDKNIEGGYSSEEVMRCIQIGLLCVQDSPKGRPSMSMVVLMLSSRSETLPLPSPMTYYPCGSTITAKAAT